MIVSKATGLLGFVKRRAKEFDNVWVTRQLYFTYVRSILEIGSIIWMPHTDEYFNRIESIQKQFLLFALRHLHSPLDCLNLPSYEHRLKDIFFAIVRST
jgi:hypothetical protein